MFWLAGDGRTVVCWRNEIEGTGHHVRQGDRQEAAPRVCSPAVAAHEATSRREGAVSPGQQHRGILVAAVHAERRATLDWAGRRRSGVSLAVARERGQAVREQVARGIDPVVARDEEQAKRRAVTLTVELAWNSYTTTHESEWRRTGTAARRKQVFRDYYGSIRNVAVADLTVAMVLKVFRPDASNALLDSRAQHTETAKKSLGWLHAVLENDQGQRGWTSAPPEEPG